MRIEVNHKKKCNNTKSTTIKFSLYNPGLNICKNTKRVIKDLIQSNNSELKIINYKSE